jgi:hypothetical protein
MKAESGRIGMMFWGDDKNDKISYRLCHLKLSILVFTDQNKNLPDENKKSDFNPLYYITKLDVEKILQHIFIHSI